MVTKLKEFLHKQPALCLVNCLELIQVGKKTDLEEFPLKSEKRLILQAKVSNFLLTLIGLYKTIKP